MKLDPNEPAKEEALSGVALRPCEDGDAEFLYQLYASTRQEELAVVPWSDAEREAFLRSQFALQHRHYHETMPDAEYDLILREGEPIGRLYLHHRPDELRVVDLALVPEHRRQGIGSALLRRLQAAAASDGKSLSLHVEQFNPALNLYVKLGFRAVNHEGVYLLLEWTPS
jgi:ribosomal protein S18 acetylase RimI-like enzyme